MIEMHDRGVSKTLNASSEAEICAKIDEWLDAGKMGRDIPLILPATGSTRRFTYRDRTIREWRYNGVTRYDTAFDPA